MTGDGKAGQHVPLGADHFPRSLAWSAKGDQLAVGVTRVAPAVAGKARFYAEVSDEILIFQPPPNALAEPLTVPHFGPAEAMAFHPDGRLAVAGGDADEVHLLSLGVGGAPKTIRGAGRRASDVTAAEPTTISAETRKIGR